MAGLAGVGAAAEAAEAAGELRFQARPRTPPPRRPAARGDRATLVAELYDAHGHRAGELFGAAIALRGPGEPAGADHLELHTFELTDGTIVGSGTAGLGEGTFAVLGGTGRYAGARGTYRIGRPEGEPAEIAVSLLS
jgi:hypothetical protein